MERRALLAALAGSALAGCGTGGGDPGADGTTPPPTDGTTVTDETTAVPPAPTGSVAPDSTPTSAWGSTPTAGPPVDPALPRTVALAGVDDAALRARAGVAATVTVPDREVAAGDTATVAVRLETTTAAGR
ncbi:MAG: hypothetical protein ABEJ42_00380, partial [Halobacteriaceae archaeon]